MYVSLLSCLQGQKLFLYKHIIQLNVMTKAQQETKYLQQLAHFNDQMMIIIALNGAET